MKILELINPNYIWNNIDVKSESDIFELVFKKGFEEGKLKETYLDSIKKREKEYPTGLYLDSYSIAIPHTDAEHTSEEFVAIIKPNSQVGFMNMEDPDEALKVDLIFLLALKDSDNQLAVLQEIMQIIQDETVVNNILNSKDNEDIMRTLKEIKDNE